MLIDITASNLVPNLGKAYARDKPDITRAGDCNVHVMYLSVLEQYNDASNIHIVTFKSCFFNDSGRNQSIYNRFFHE
jgi:hypothetical protein